MSIKPDMLAEDKTSSYEAELAKTGVMDSSIQILQYLTANFVLTQKIHWFH